LSRPVFLLQVFIESKVRGAMNTVDGILEWLLARRNRFETVC
jgi:hypothetical protein